MVVTPTTAKAKQKGEGKGVKYPSLILLVLLCMEVCSLSFVWKALVNSGVPTIFLNHFVMVKLRCHHDHTDKEQDRAARKGGAKYS